MSDEREVTEADLQRLHADLNELADWIDAVHKRFEAQGADRTADALVIEVRRRVNRLIYRQGIDASDPQVMAEIRAQYMASRR
jgi:hypothetical protein